MICSGETELDRMSVAEGTSARGKQLLVRKITEPVSVLVFEMTRAWPGPWPGSSYSRPEGREDVNNPSPYSRTVHVTDIEIWS